MSGQEYRIPTWPWVAMAASRDSARPVLTGVYADGQQVACTDGHRLHTAPLKAAHLLPGIYGAQDLAEVDGKYPNYQQVMHTPEQLAKAPQLDVTDSRLLKAVRGAAAYERAAGGGSFFVTVPAPGGAAHLSPRYLLDALLGFQPWSSGRGKRRTWVAKVVRVHAPGQLLQVQVGEETAGSRQAVIMPVRTAWWSEAAQGPPQVPTLDLGRWLS